MSPGTVLNSHHHGVSMINGVLNETPNGANDFAAGKSRPRDPIAIIGISAKFGGSATDPSKLWDMVAERKSAWSPIPKDRFDIKSFYHVDKDKPGRSHSLGGHFMTEDVGLFDAGFFSLSADAASAMDPQLRLLLESVHEAFENAGITLEKAAGTDTSVYTGVYGKDYHDLQTRDPDVLPAAFLTGNGMAMLSNRISHFYDLRGASMTIDTGCSSGLVALHQASHSILSGESEMSVVGASSTILNPDLYIAMSTLSMVGADGICYAWDARAQGYGRGEGVAALVLKRLDAALRDGHHVHAVIRETCLNQDGATKTITSPSIEAQIKLINKCYSRAGLNLSDTSYVEAHMTGTPVGDLAEATALAQTFGKARKPGDPIYVGSVKTNLGHTEPVSGLAAIIKTIYAMENRVIPPNINYQTPNPNIPLEKWNLAVPTSLIPWPKDKPLRASINNFGYGGANSHVILEAAPKFPSIVPIATPSWQAVQSRIFFLSAKDQVAIRGMIDNLATYISTLPNDIALGSIAYTLAERRSRYQWVAAIRASNRGELVKRLRQSSIKVSHTTKKPRLGFVLNGQGAQWYAMGRELISAYPIFGDSIHRADKILKGYGANWSLKEELMRDPQSTRVGKMHLSQPITVALQLCLLDLLTSWGILPSAVSSHSSGEIAAAYAVGALTFAEALGAAFYRGDIPSRKKELSTLAGGMLAVGIGRDDATKYIEDTTNGHVVVACVNSPESVPISGDLAAINEVEARLTAEGIFAKKLQVPLAYHSHHMQLLGNEYAEKLRDIIVSQPDGQWPSRYRYASPVTGDIVSTADILRPEYFVRNLTNPVLFSQAFEKMCFDEDGGAHVDVIVEIGAHGTLAGPIRQILKGREIPYLSTLSRNVDALRTMQNLAVDLLGYGCDVSLPSINSPFGEKHTFVHDLPKYAWNHSTRYWVESRINRELRNRRFEPHELLGSLLPGDNGLAPTWRNFLRLADISWLIDHQIQGYVVFPGAGYITMAVEAMRLLTRPNGDIISFKLRDIDILNALTVPNSTKGVEVQFTLCPAKGGWHEFSVSSLTLSNVWIVNCTGFIRAQHTAEAADRISTANFFHPGVKSANIDPESLWADLRKMNMYHGPTFRPINNIKTARDKTITEISVKDVVSQTQEYVIHPTTLDGILIAAYNGLPRKIRDGFTVVPRKIEGITIRSDLHNKGGEELRCLSQVNRADTNGFDSTIAVTNGGKNDVVSLKIDHLFAQAIPREANASEEKRGIISRMEWEADLTSTIPAAFKEALRVKPEDDKQTDFERKTLRVAFHFISDAVEELGITPDRLSPKYTQLFHWMKTVIVLAAADKLGPRSNTWAHNSKGTKQMLADEVNSKGIAYGRLVVRVGRQLPKILRGEADPFEVVNSDNLLSQFYIGHPKLEEISFKQLAQISEQLAINRPGAHVLELGAGNGAATRVVLEAFGAGLDIDGTRTLLERYYFTDTCTDQFGAVAETLAPWSDLLSFKQLNIEKDLGEQGFTPAKYDLIVASQSLHKTDSLYEALRNMHKLLKAGGKLLLIETTQQQLEQKLVFGILPGSTPSTSIQMWDQILRETGFSGVQLEAVDSEDARRRSFSVIMTGKEVTKGSYPSSVSIVYAREMPPEHWLKELTCAVQAQTGANPIVESLYDLEVSTGTTYIFAIELLGPFVSYLDRPSFEKLKRVLVGSQNILWLSSAGLVDMEEPLVGATSGLLRVLRQEDASKRCVHLDFAKTTDGNVWAGENVDHIVDIFKRTFEKTFCTTDQDWEYSVKESVLFVPRCYPEIEDQDFSELPSPNIDRTDATYLIIGGMGGIGQHIASWMMEKGAKNVLIVSRNAETSPDIADMRAMAQADGCNLQIRSCDVGDEHEFVKLLAEVAIIMPPIRGVVNAAMVLKNSVLENMSYEVWQSGIRVKIDSSINAHQHLPFVDFFVQLSSAIGIPGHPSQAHYAAGNTFQDALARHRTSRGLPAVTLDLTAIEGIGWMAQQGDAELDVLKRIEKVGLTSTRIDTVMDLIEAAIRDSLRTSSAASQVIVGLSTYKAIPDDAVTRSDRRFGTLRLATVRASALVPFTDASGAKDSLAELAQAVANGTATKVAGGALVIDALTGKIAAIFNLEKTDIDHTRTLSHYGVDSLVAVELRNWLATHLKAKVSIFDILQCPSIAEFGALLTGKSELLEGLK